MKLLLRLAVVLVLGLFLLLALLFVFRDDLIESSVEGAGKYAFGVPTPLAGVRTDVGSGDFALEDFRISNPPGFSDTPVFALGSASMKLPLTRLRGDDELVIDEVRVSGLAVHLERGAQGFNFTPLVERVRELSAAADVATGEPRPAPEGDAPAPAAPGRPMVVRRLVLEDWTLGLDFGQGLRLPPKGLRSLVLEDVRTDGQGLAGILGQAAEQLLAYVQDEGLSSLGLDALSPEFLAQVDSLRARLEQDLPDLDDLRADLEQRADEELERLEGLAGERVEELQQEAREELDQLLEQVLGDQELPPGTGEKLDQLLEQAGGALELPPETREKVNELLEKATGDESKLKELEQKAKEKLGGLGGLLGGKKN